MLKKIAMAITERLLRIKFAIVRYQWLKRKQRHQRLCAELLHSGGQAQTDADEDAVIADYTDGRMMGQRQVTPNFVRPFGLKR